MSDVTAKFAENLRRLRKIHGLSQDALAKRLNEQGLSWYPVQVLRIEKGTQEPKLGQAVALAQIFNLSLEEMLGELPGLCMTCLGVPPKGFTCNDCSLGARGATT